MPFPPSDRRRNGERRLLPSRRRALERRMAERRRVLTPLLPDRRLRADRREGIERRSFPERRSSSDRRAPGETVGEHIRNALQLLRNLGDAGVLDREHQGDLDAAVRRLGLALLELQYAALRQAEQRSRST